MDDVAGQLVSGEQASLDIFGLHHGIIAVFLVLYYYILPHF